MADTVPRGAILRIGLKTPQLVRERWCVVLTDPGRLDTPRFGVVPLSQVAPANDLHPIVAATPENRLGAGEWRARVTELFTAHPDNIVGGHKVSVLPEELARIDGALRSFLRLPFLSSEKG